MPVENNSKLQYQLTGGKDGKIHYVDKDDFDKHYQEYAQNASKGSTIRMVKDGEQYDIPLGSFGEALRQGGRGWNVQRKTVVQKQPTKPVSTQKPQSTKDQAMNAVQGAFGTQKPVQLGVDTPQVKQVAPVEIPQVQTPQAQPKQSAVNSKTQQKMSAEEQAQAMQFAEDVKAQAKYVTDQTPRDIEAIKKRAEKERKANFGGISLNQTENAELNKVRTDRANDVAINAAWERDSQKYVPEAVRAVAGDVNAVINDALRGLNADAKSEYGQTLGAIGSAGNFEQTTKDYLGKLTPSSIQQKLEEIDTDKLSKQLFFNGDGSDYSQWIKDAAQKAKMSPDKYIKYVASPAIGRQLQAGITQALGKETDKYKVKNYGDFLLRKFNDGVVGQITQIGLLPKEMRQMNANAVENYSEGLGFWGKAGGFGTSMVGDLPLMMIGGGIGTQATKVVGTGFSKLAQTTVGKTGIDLMAKGASKLGATRVGEAIATYAPKIGQIITPAVEKFGSKEAAARYESFLLANMSRPSWYGREILKGSIHGAANMGSFMGTKGVIETINVGDDTSGGALLTAFAEGAWSGVKMGGAMALASPLGKLAPTLSKAYQRVGTKVGAKLGELGAFVGIDAIDNIGNDKWNFTDSLLNNASMIVGFGISGKITGMMSGRNPFGEWRDILKGRDVRGAKLTASELAEIRKVYGNEPFFSMFDMTDVEAKRFQDAIKNGDANALQQLKDYQQKFTNFIDNPEISFETRQKVSAVLFGTVQANRPLMGSFNVEGNTVKLRASDGELIAVREFENAEELQDIVNFERNNAKVSKVRDMFAKLGCGAVPEGVDTEKVNSDTYDALRQTAAEHGMDEVELTVALMKDPAKLSDLEVQAQNALGYRLRRIISDINDGKLAPEASAEAGRAEAEDVDVEDITNVPEVVTRLKEEKERLIVESINASNKAQALRDEKGIDNTILTEQDIQMLVNNGMITTDEAQVFLDEVATRNNSLNADAKYEAFVGRVGEKINEYLDNKFYDMQFNGKDSSTGGLSMMDTVLMGVDRNGAPVYIKDGILDGQSVKAGESGMIIVKDAETGEMRFLTEDEVSVTGQIEKESYLAPMRQNMQEDITEAWRLFEDGQGANGNEGGSVVAEQPRTEPQQPVVEGNEGEGEMPVEPEVPTEEPKPTPAEAPVAEGGEAPVVAPTEAPVGGTAPVKAPVESAKPEYTPITEADAPANVNDKKAYADNVNNWNQNKKVGRTTEVTLADGRTIKAHYVLYGAHDAVASHDPHTFEQSKGVPTREDGTTLNDRDYEHDKEAQLTAQSHSNDFDGRAWQDMPIFFKDSPFVASGNDRTIAGTLAAEKGTDTKYRSRFDQEYDTKGFTEEDVRAIEARGEKPRIGIELDEELPYTTESYAMFNKTNMKKRNHVEEAVAQGKVMREKPQVVSAVTALFDRVENLSDLYGNEDLCKALIQFLEQGGVITKEEAIEWLNEDGELSDIGKKKFETIMTAIVLDEDSIRLLNNPEYRLGKVRQNIAYAIAELMKNERLGADYKLLGDFNKAIELFGRSKGAGNKTETEMLDWLMNEVLDDDGNGNFVTRKPMDGYTLNEILIALQMGKGQKAFKAFFKSYNEQAKEAANGQTSMFDEGNVLDKDTIINQLIEAVYGKDPANNRRIEKLKAFFGVKEGESPVEGNDGAEGTGEGVKPEEGTGEAPTAPEGGEKPTEVKTDEATGKGEVPTEEVKPEEPVVEEEPKPENGFGDDIISKSERDVKIAEVKDNVATITVDGKESNIKLIANESGKTTATLEAPSEKTIARYEKSIDDKLSKSDDGKTLEFSNIDNAIKFEEWLEKDDPLTDSSLPFEDRIEGYDRLDESVINELEMNKFGKDQVRGAIKKLIEGRELSALEKQYYIKALDYVRNTERNGADDSTNANESLVAEGNNDSTSRPDGEEGRPTGGLDNQESGEKGQGSEDSEGGLPSTDGGESNKPTEGENAEPGKRPTRGGGRKGSGGTRSNGGNGNKPTSKRESGKVLKADERAAVDARIDENKKKLAELLGRVKKTDANKAPKMRVSLVGGLDAWIEKQADKIDWEVFGEIGETVADIGIDYIKRGVYDVKTFIKKLRGDIEGLLKEVFDWDDKIVDEFIENQWNSQYSIGDESHTMAEWAGIMKMEALRAEVKRNLQETILAQKNAESKEVVVGDRDNIDDTLPMLLVEQRDDVMKTETQFFDPTHADAKHGNGKGILFTNGTGTGKTYTGLGIVKRFVKQGKGRVLILTPSQKKVDDWKEDGKNLFLDIKDLGTIAKEENAKGAKTSATKVKGSGVVITTYANAAANDALLEDVFDLIVYDESHKIMENKQGKVTNMALAHHMLSNRDVETATERMKAIHPLWKEEAQLNTELEEIENELVKVGGYDNTLLNRVNEINGRIAKIHEEQQKIEPTFAKDAKEAVARTKVVFLSATPFNNHKNLDYAEGYIFSYDRKKEDMKREDAQRDFLVSTFPHGYKRSKKGGLQEKVTDGAALSEEEVRFADKLKDMGVQSGRTLNNGFDYSRDFPEVSVRMASEFNTAVGELMQPDNPLKEFHKFNDYNTMSVLFETMKASAVMSRIKEHLDLGRKIVVFHRRVNDNKNVARPPFAEMLRTAREHADTNGNLTEDQKVKLLEECDFFEWKYRNLLDWEQTLDYSMPRAQLQMEFGGAKYEDYERQNINSIAHEMDDKSLWTNESDVENWAKRLANAVKDEPTAIGFVEDLHPVKEDVIQIPGEEDSAYEKRVKKADKNYQEALKPYEAFKKKALKTIKKVIEERVKAGELEQQRYADGRLIKRVGFFAGADSNGSRSEDVADFNNDDSQMNIIVVQEQSGKEGISLHDVTGKHQRVIMNLALPQSPIAFIQMEGRIFRIGQMSNAIFEYPLLGLGQELGMFAQRINGAAATTENLALGSDARNLRKTIASGVMLHSGNIKVGKFTQGIGGVEFDNPSSIVYGYDKALKDYHEHSKRMEEGVEYDGTPEPIGFKMVEWARAEKGDNFLEPSAGEGNISRYIPAGNKSLSLESDNNRYSQLMINTGGMAQGSDAAHGQNTLVKLGKFEDLNVGANKANIVLINPPKGMEASHIEKAWQHLKNSGRMIVVGKMPEVNTSYFGEESMKPWLDTQTNAFEVMTIKLPADKANGISEIHIIDKVDRKELSNQVPEKEVLDLTNTESTDALFTRLRNVEAPQRTIDPSVRYQEVANTYRQNIESNKVSDESYTYCTDTGITVYLKGNEGDRMAREIAQTKFFRGGMKFDDIYKLNEGIDKLYKEMSEALDIEDQTEFLKKVFPNRDFRKWERVTDLSDKLQKQYYENARELFDETCNFIREITGLTDDQLKRSATGEDVRTRAKVKVGDKLDLSTIRKLFESVNGNRKEIQARFDKIFKVAKAAGLQKGTAYDNTKDGSSAGYYWATENAFSINAEEWNKKEAVGSKDYREMTPDEFRASVIHHEMTHAVTCYALDLAKEGTKLRDSADEIRSLQKLSEDTEGSNKLVRIHNGYMFENVKEFVAEAESNEVARKAMSYMMVFVKDGENGKREYMSMKDVYEKIADENGITFEEAQNLPGKMLENQIKNLVSGYEKSNVLAEFDKSLDKMLKEFDQDLFDDYVKRAGGTPRGDAMPTSPHLDTEFVYRTAEQNTAKEKEAPAVVRQAAAKAIEVLGGKGHVHKSYEYLPEEGKEALRKNPKAMGWYNKKTGKVHIYLPNCPTAYEAERTVLHEKVGHEGLRNVVGEENYKKFLMSVWEGVGRTARHEIQEIASRNEWNYHKAVDEWLAKRAEDFDIDKDGVKRSTWRKITDAFNTLLHKLGIKNGMSEKDIREALWLSRHSLDNRDGNFDYTARKAAFKDKLGRYQPREKVSKDGRVWDDAGEDGDVLARTMTDKDREAINDNLTPQGQVAQDEYEESIRKVSHLWTEAFQNAGRSLQKAVTAIIGRGKEIDPSQDSFKLLNQLGSKNQQGMKTYDRTIAQPLQRTLGKILPYFDGKKTRDRYTELQHYVYGKHALERNRVLAVRDFCANLAKTPDQPGAPISNKDYAENIQKQFDAERVRLFGELQAKNITLRDYYMQLDGFIKGFINDWDASKRDVSGISDTEFFKYGTGNKGEYRDDELINDIMNTEAKIGEKLVGELWDRIGEAAGFAREYDYNSGFHNSRANKRMEEMFSWYVPLRGFSADTAEDMYYYMHDKGTTVGKSAVKASGRMTASDRPLETLLAMGCSSIMRGNRNKAKQALVRLVRNNPNNLITEMKTYYLEGEDAVTGNKELTALYPDFREEMTAKEVENAIENFEANIQARKANGEKIVFLNDRKTGTPYRIIRDRNKEQHFIHAWINGKDVTLIIHGNPRAAQYVNGQISNYRIPVLSYINSFESQLATSKSLTFMGRNSIRDYNYATISVLATEGLKYNYDFQKMYWSLSGKNVANFVPGMVTGVYDIANRTRVRMKDGKFAEPTISHHGVFNSMKNLFVKYRNGTLDMTNETEKYFKEFVENGGMTGYTQLQGVEEWKEEIDNVLEDAYGASGPKRAKQIAGKVINIGTLGTTKLIKSYFSLVDSVNEAAENQARFACYYASRKANRKITRAIDDAKSISVNFNKTGAGSATMKLKNMGDVSWWYRLNATTAGMSATALKNTMWFFNAGVQGMSRTYQLAMGEGVNEKTFVQGLGKAMKTGQFYKSMLGFAAYPFVLGFAGAFLNQMIATAMDDDNDRKKYGENPYTQLPEYVRRDNWCLYLGHGRFAMLPWAIETRAMYAQGDLAASMFFPDLAGDRPIGEQVLMNMAQMTPVDIFGGSKVGSNDLKGGITAVLMPDVFEGVKAAGIPGLYEGTNVGWTGTPISYASSKDSQSNDRFDPKWQHANPKTGQGYVEIAKGLSKATGGDDIRPGKIDLDASKLEYLLNTYGSGPMKDVNEAANFFANAIEKEGNVEGGKVPVLKAVYRNASPANSMNTDRTRWYAYKNKYNEIISHAKSYDRAGRDVDTSARYAIGDKRIKIARLVNGYSQTIKKMEAIKNKSKRRADRDMWQDRINETIHEVMMQIDAIENGKK